MLIRGRREAEEGDAWRRRVKLRVQDESDGCERKH
jgi:uncharacterized phage protein gp47/JayE